jgi:hypothetical protein
MSIQETVKYIYFEITSHFLCRVKRYTLKNKTRSMLKLFLEVRSDTDSFQVSRYVQWYYVKIEGRN